MKIAPTREQLIALLRVPTTADCEAIAQDLRKLTDAAIKGDAPGSEANYITDVYVGEISDARHIVIRFSKFGNACYSNASENTIVSSDQLDKLLETRGWRRLCCETVESVLFPDNGVTVWDSFFVFT